MTVGKSDPNYAAALEAVRRARAAVSGTDPVTGAPYAARIRRAAGRTGSAAGDGLLEDLEEAKHVTDWLESTLIQLDEARQRRRHSSPKGSTKSSTAARSSPDGAARLADAAANARQTASPGSSGGAVALVGGIDRLGGGAEALEAGLAEAARTLGAAAERPASAPASRCSPARRRINHQARPGRRATPGLFNSGYFVLSALDGAAADAREAVGETIDLEHGGQAATMLVISSYPFNTPGSIALNKRLDDEAERLGDEAGLDDRRRRRRRPAQRLQPASPATGSRWSIAAITLATFLVLVLVLRALPLAAIAVGLNLLTVGGRLRHPHPALQRARRTGRWAATPTSTRSARR